MSSDSALTGLFESGDRDQWRRGNIRGPFSKNKVLRCLCLTRQVNLSIDTRTLLKG